MFNLIHRKLVETNFHYLPLIFISFIIFIIYII